MRIGQTLCVIAVMGTLAAGAATPERPPIAIGSFGNEDFAKSYRLLVEEALIENGFKVVTLFHLNSREGPDHHSYSGNVIPDCWTKRCAQRDFDPPGDFVLD
jgi:hypothetical protein